MLKEKYTVKIVVLFYVLIFTLFYCIDPSTFAFRVPGNFNNASQNIVPFSTISTYLFNYDKYNTLIWLYNILGNIVIFVPLGFFIPFIHLKANQFITVIVSSLLISLVIEVLQFITSYGIFDVDDIALNTIGAIIGFLIFKLYSK